MSHGRRRRLPRSGATQTTHARAADRALPSVTTSGRSRRPVAEKSALTPTLKQHHRGSGVDAPDNRRRSTASAGTVGVPYECHRRGHGSRAGNGFNSCGLNQNHADDRRHGGGRPGCAEAFPNDQRGDHFGEQQAGFPYRGHHCQRCPALRPEDGLEGGDAQEPAEQASPSVRCATAPRRTKPASSPPTRSRPSRRPDLSASGRPVPPAHGGGSRSTRRAAVSGRSTACGSRWSVLRRRAALRLPCSTCLPLRAAALRARAP